MQKSTFTNILWAVDALSENHQHQQSLLVLGAIQRATGAKIEPVFILSPANSEVPAHPFTRAQEAYRALAEKEFQRVTKDCDLADLKPLKILTNPENSKSRDIEIITEYARATGADLILSSTHARGGLAKLFIGSFTESLLVRSPVDVITVNPDTNIREGIRKILFPTDFNPRFLEPFKKAMALAHQLDADLTLYYKEPEISTMFMNPEVRDFLIADNEARVKRADVWEDMARKSGVRVRVDLEEEGGPIIPSILQAAEGFDLIMMASQADPVSAWLMGSKVKALAKQAPCPLCVLRIT